MKKKSLKVLHLIHHLHIGGAERILVSLVQSLLGHDSISCSVAVIKSGGELEQDIKNHNIPLYNLHKDKYLFRFLIDLRRIIRSGNFDVLHMHCFSAALWGRLCSIGTNTKIRVFTDHDIAGWNNPIKHLIINRLLFPFTSRIVSVSEAARQALIHNEKIKGDSVEVIANGINMTRLLNAPSVEQCRRKFSLTDMYPVIGMAARNSKEKGIDLFINAISILKKKGIRITGVIAGNGPLHEDLKALSRSLGVEEDVRFLGSIMPEKIGEVLNCFDIGICPSRQESFGIAAVEMMAFGKAVIASDTGGLPEVINHGENGLIFEKENITQIVQCLELLINNQKFRNEIALKGKKHVMSTYTLEVMTKRYVDLYTRLYEMA